MNRTREQILADLTGQQVWTCNLAAAAAAGAAVQAAAAVTGQHTAKIAEQWEPRYEVVAEPRAQDAARSEDVREAYRAALPLAKWRKE